jgi:hypothetical protein
MADENPFAVSEFCRGDSSQAVVATDPYWFRIDGNMLVCGPVVRLPEICCLTGDDHNLVARTAVPEYPTLKIVLVARKCTVHYSLSKRSARKQQHIYAASIVGMLSGIVLIIFGHIFWQLISPRDSSFHILLGFILIILSLILATRTRPRLQLMHYQSPGHFWIRGFAPECLARLRQIAFEGQSNQ